MGRERGGVMPEHCADCRDTEAEDASITERNCGHQLCDSCWWNHYCGDEGRQ